ncbi:MFS transporter [Actinomadura macrotermitis]|uniref:Inner membrane protein YbjJ n=1 Tax=Actinomadura macrotermitis TaxID=2585200 RepID=A0A7K0C6S8_9ACTN|nr:MFS transporter [Actinomadura macrotermitis]MQY09046.1 Inner membrane protein YbjJ [Actinomadura macrotermitis]
MNRHHRAITLVFALHGAVSGSLATRVPWLQDHLGLGPSVLGLALLCPSVGAFLGMPTAARLSHRLGGAATTRILIALWCAGLALPALAPAPAWLFAAFLLYGATAGMSDVVMNGHAVDLERHLGRSIISGLHGMWCVGSLAGGGIGMLAAHAHLDARIHLGAMSAALLAAGLAAGRGLFTGGGEVGAPVPRRFALPSRAVLGIGVLGFCGTFAEGASADWAAVYLTEVTGAGPGLAAGGFLVFVLCMAATRLAGDRLIRRFGPVAVVRGGGAAAVLGGALVVTAVSPVMGAAGFALVGTGVATVVPLVFAAAGASGPAASEGVAGVATITYLSGLTAPAVTGWVAGAASYPAAFAMITAMAGATALLAGALRPRPAPPAALGTPCEQGERETSPRDV